MMAQYPKIQSFHFKSPAKLWKMLSCTSLCALTLYIRRTDCLADDVQSSCKVLQFLCARNFSLCVDHVCFDELEDSLKKPDEIPDFSDLADSFPAELPEEPCVEELKTETVEPEPEPKSTDSSISFFTGNRGKKLILYQGNKFCLHRNLACGETSWICCTKPCPARLRCSKDFVSILKARLDHKHPPPELKKLERAKVCNEAKRVAMEALTDQPTSLIEAVISTKNFESLSKEDVKLVRNNLYRLRRARKKQQQEEPRPSGTLSDDPDSLPDLDTSHSGLSFSSFRSDDEFGVE